MDDTQTMLLNILSQVFLEVSIAFVTVLKGFRIWVYLFGAEMAGKLSITVLHVENFTMVVVFGL